MINSIYCHIKETTASLRNKVRGALYKLFPDFKFFKKSLLWPTLFLTFVFCLWVVLQNWNSLVAFWDILRIEDDNKESHSTTIRNIGLAVAGIVALGFAIWRGIVAQKQANAAHQQSEVAQQGLFNERYQKGAEMLGNEVLSVRLGGIYALRSLAEERPEQYHVLIMRLLCAFIRHPTRDDSIPIVESSRDGHYNQKPKLREDIQAAMDTICACHEVQYRLNERIESYLDLRRANLSGARLRFVNLTIGQRPFQGTLAEMLGHHSGADFSEVLLCSADLSFAKFPSADFNRAILCNAELIGSDISNATFWDADLSGASLSHANLTGADLLDVNLSATELNETNLSGAKLTNTGYQGIAELTGLTQAQLDEARADPDNPPILEGVRDAETGNPLIWRGKPLEDEQSH